MLAAGLFAALLILALIVGDWIHFTRLTASARRYGCGIGREEDRLPCPCANTLPARFHPHGVLALPHGIARWFGEDNTIVLRPQYRLFSRGFRTAWPIKGSIEVKGEGETTRLLCVKRIPWSSAIVTLLWFALVGLGTLAFVVAYALEGGLDSLGSLLLGLGIAGVGAAVFAFGLITVVLAYRLENARLRQAYGELRDALLIATIGHPS